MRKFDFYEFAGVIVPGAVLLIGAALCSPGIHEVIFEQEMSIGEAALALIASYGLGHLLQAIGNLIERIWWFFWGGMPSDWPRSRSHHLLAHQQILRLDGALHDRLGITVSESLNRLPNEDWHAIVRQIYTLVSGSDRAQRVDVFNGNYGLNRGLAAALATILVVVIVLVDPIPWRIVPLLVVACCIALYKMHRFGVHYARELFVQFLTLSISKQPVEHERMESSQ